MAKKSKVKPHKRVLPSGKITNVKGHSRTRPEHVPYKERIEYNQIKLEYPELSEMDIRMILMTFDNHGYEFQDVFEILSYDDGIDVLFDSGKTIMMFKTDDALYERAEEHLDSSLSDLGILAFDVRGYSIEEFMYNQDFYNDHLEELKENKDRLEQLGWKWYEVEEQPLRAWADANDIELYRDQDYVWDEAQDYLNRDFIQSYIRSNAKSLVTGLDYPDWEINNGWTIILV